MGMKKEKWADIESARKERDYSGNGKYTVFSKPPYG